MTSTTLCHRLPYHDRFYAALFAEAIAASSGPVQGTNSWAWVGYERPDAKPTGDPPHETPGWSSVYDVDVSTLTILEAHAIAMNKGKSVRED